MGENKEEVKQEIENNPNEIKIPKKTFRIVLLSLLAVALVVTSIFVIPKFIKEPDDPNPPIDNPDDPNEHTGGCTDKGCPVEFTDKTMTGYDYIMSIMSAPQYWSEEDMPPYNLESDEEEAMSKLVNGTGWKLLDEATATFTRGNEGTLTINFSTFYVECVRTDGYTRRNQFDYNNKTFLYVVDEYPELNGDSTGHLTEEEWRAKYGNNYFENWDARWYIKDFILAYEEKFAAIGCPLLNQPAGTLESYKDKIIKVPKEQESDGLIHAPWEQDNFTWDYTKDESIVWLKDYTDIFNQQAPESELEVVGYKGADYNMQSYSPLYEVFMYKDDCSKYLDRNPHTASIWGATHGSYDSDIGAFAFYFLMPAMKEIYGYNAVYFVDRANMRESGTEIHFNMSKEEFINKAALLVTKTKNSDGSYTTSSQLNEIATVYLEGDINVGSKFVNDLGHSILWYRFLEVKEVAKYYNKEFKYADDYVVNFEIYYSFDLQRLLGLR